MGRRKKVVEIDEEKFSSMGREEKLYLFRDFTQLFYYELSKIPYSEITITQSGNPESIAEEYYKDRGYEVYRSRVNGGYRCIGVEFYWQNFSSKLSEDDKMLIERLKYLMSPSEFKELAYMVKDKNGTPDLLVIKDKKISFTEVKFNYETVKPSTVEFYIRYGNKWPTSILRVLRK
ncbi:MAG: hypothetical protein EA366_03885 [Spirulina sp. DLM2.Bin59]|nr:MAG: hypothetical protein EA366_03885 [Spirulina sp. DLM2.Bin59]